VADAAVEMSQSLAQAVGGGEGVGGGLLDVGVGHAHHAGDGGGTGGVGAARTAEGQDQGVIGGAGEAAGLGVGQRWRRGHGGGRLQGGEGFAGAEVEVAFGDPAAAHAVGLDRIQSRRVSSTRTLARRRISMMLRAPASGCSRSAVAWVTVAVWALARGLETSRVRARAKRSLWIMGTSGTEVGAGRGCRSVLRQHDNDLHPCHAELRRCREGLTPAAIR
jgi:hypothetical protein